MTVLPKDKDEADAIGCLVVGTESKRVLILDPSGTSVLESIIVPSVPVFMTTGGCVDIDFRIVIACRDCNVYTIKVCDFVF
jgi:Bardet-Biedl syndrome 1 protein